MTFRDRARSRGPRLVLIFLLGAVLLCVAGCGTLDANFHVTYLESGDTIEQMAFRGTGALGNTFAGPDNRDSLLKSGWQVETKADGDTTTMTASATRKRGERLLLTSSTNGAGLIDQLTVVETPGLFKKAYDVTFSTTPMQAATPTATTTPGTSLIDDKQTAQLLDAMVKLGISITLPGEIVESNADSTQGNTGTWLFTFSSLQKSRDIHVRSEKTQWLNIGIGAFAGVLVLAGVGYLLVRRRSAPSVNWLVTRRYHLTSGHTSRAS